MTLFRLAMRGARDGLRDIKAGGRVSQASLESMLTRKETYELLGYTPSVDWDYPCPNSEVSRGPGGARAGKARSKFKQE
jgi:hypothetical protein